MELIEIDGYWANDIRVVGGLPELVRKYPLKATTSKKRGSLNEVF